MPLLRIESRDKEGGQKPSRREHRASKSSSGSAMPAVLGGLVVGLIIVIGVAAFMVGRNRATSAPAPAPAPLAPAADAGVPAQQQGPVPASGPFDGSEAGRRLPTPEPQLNPLNADYPRETVIGWVNGQTYTMGELETAVRVAKVLGSLTGDVVPDFGTPEQQEFQVRMLRRQLDILLVKQAASAAGVALPGEPVENLIADFMTRVGGSDAQLQQLMTTYGVSDEMLSAWFEDSALVNTYVAYALLGERDPSEREMVTSQWLAEQWQANEIYVNFYDPEELGITPDDTPAP